MAYVRKRSYLALTPPCLFSQLGKFALKIFSLPALINFAMVCWQLYLIPTTHRLHCSGLHGGTVQARHGGAAQETAHHQPGGGRQLHHHLQFHLILHREYLVCGYLRSGKISNWWQLCNLRGRGGSCVDCLFVLVLLSSLWRRDTVEHFLSSLYQILQI